jgi:hypothetical protein
VTDLPNNDDMNSLFLNNKRIIGTKKVNNTKYPLDIKCATLKNVRNTNNELVHNKYIDIYSSK